MHSMFRSGMMVFENQPSFSGSNHSTYNKIVTVPYSKVIRLELGVLRLTNVRLHTLTIEECGTLNKISMNCTTRAATALHTFVRSSKLETQQHTKNRLPYAQEGKEKLYSLNDIAERQLAPKQISKLNIHAQMNRSDYNSDWLVHNFIRQVELGK